jgi:hypothetical protein
MDKITVYKGKTVVKKNIDKAKIHNVEPDVEHIVKPVLEQPVVEHEIKPVKKLKTVVKKKNDKAKTHTVEPIVQHTVQPVLEHEIKPVKKLKTFVKKNIDKAKIHNVEPVVEQIVKTDNNSDKTVELLENKISCDQINIFNESHKKKLKKCLNNNFNIFD